MVDGRVFITNSFENMQSTGGNSFDYVELQTISIVIGSGVEPDGGSVLGIGRNATELVLFPGELC
jgi:hypothetical protein